jgi:hypothetical protein
MSGWRRFTENNLWKQLISKECMRIKRTENKWMGMSRGDDHTRYIDSPANGVAVEGSQYFKCWLGNRVTIEIPSTARHNVSSESVLVQFYA